MNQTEDAMLFSLNLATITNQQPIAITHDFAVKVLYFYKEYATGFMTQTNRCVYFGTISHQTNRAHGIGILFLPNNLIYVGNFHETSTVKNAMHGYGILFYGCKETYFEGSFVNNLRCGQGKLIVNCKLVYTGTWMNDQTHGKGYIATEEFQYEGSFSNGNLNGFGIATYTNGYTYHGSFQNGERNGQGKVVFPYSHKTTPTCSFTCSHTIEGTFANDQCVHGTLQCGSSYYTYTGEFKAYKHHGKGVFKYNTNHMYIGEVKDGFPNGLGTKRMPNGDILQGFFKKGMCNGQAIYTFVNGGTFSGEWKDNVCKELELYLQTMLTNGAQEQLARYKHGYSQLAKFVNDVVNNDKYKQTNDENNKLSMETILLSDSDDDDEECTPVVIKESASRSCLKKSNSTNDCKKQVTWIDL